MSDFTQRLASASVLIGTSASLLYLIATTPGLMPSDELTRQLLIGPWACGLMFGLSELADLARTVSRQMRGKSRPHRKLRRCETPAAAFKL